MGGGRRAIASLGLEEKIFQFRDHIRLGGWKQAMEKSSSRWNNIKLGGWRHGALKPIPLNNGLCCSFQATKICVKRVYAEN